MGSLTLTARRIRGAPVRPGSAAREWSSFSLSETTYLTDRLVRSITTSEFGAHEGRAPIEKRSCVLILLPATQHT
jgi:hypothetical protein